MAVDDLMVSCLTITDQVRAEERGSKKVCHLTTRAANPFADIASTLDYFARDMLSQRNSREAQAAILLISRRTNMESKNEPAESYDHEVLGPGVRFGASTPMTPANLIIRPVLIRIRKSPPRCSD